MEVHGTMNAAAIYYHVCPACLHACPKATRCCCCGQPPLNWKPCPHWPQQIMGTRAFDEAELAEHVLVGYLLGPEQAAALPIDLESL